MSENKPTDARLERKVRFAREEPDSIFIVPFAKQDRFAMVYMARSADRLINTIKRKAGFTLSFEAAKKLLKVVDKFAEELWNHALSLTPRLHNFNRQRWRDLNDTKEEKMRLAHRRTSYAIVPRSEEAAQIAMAVKIIENRHLEIRQTGNLDEIEKVTEDYKNLLTSFDTFLGKLAKELGIEYDSPLKRDKKEPETNAETA